MIGNRRGAAIAAGEDRAIAGDDVNDRVGRGLHALTSDRRRRRTEEVKVGVEVAAHVLVKSFRKKSQDKPLANAAFRDICTTVSFVLMMT